MRALSSILLVLSASAALHLVGVPSTPLAHADDVEVAASDVVHFDIGPEESARLFAVAKSNWEAQFRPKKLKTTLRGLAKGTTPMSDELKQQLYVVRKTSSIVRASFQLLDEGHGKPKALDSYCRAAGKLNDAINAGHYDEIPKLAKKTLKAMNVSKIRAEVDGFQPTTKESFNGYLYTSMLFAERAGSNTALSAPVFHQLRKEMTNLLVLFEPGKKLSGPMQKLHDRLHKLRFDMGDVHDDLVARKTGKPADYHTKQVKLTKMTRSDVRNVLRSIRVQTPASRGVHYNRWKANVKPGRGGTKAAPRRGR